MVDRLIKLCQLLLMLVVALEGLARAQPFTDEATTAGLDAVSGGYGVAWGDYDDDGFVDLFVSGANRLFHNDGDGTFTGGVTLPGESCCKRAAHWGDFDDDGDLDLIHTRGPYLFRNDAGTFVHLENSAVGLSGMTNLGDVAWLDANGDGLLDLWAPNGASPGNHIFVNDGDGTFTDQGVDALGLVPSGNGETTIVFDYDDDRDADILYRRSGVLLWRAEDDGTFTEVSTAAGLSLTDTGGGYNGTAAGDYDNDGDLDLYGGQPTANKLYRNEGDGSFSDVTAASGAGGAALDTRGVSWGDYDNDGDLDLFVANSNGANALFRNAGDGTFSDVAGALGLADTAASSGAVWADVDNDGDLDLFVAGSAANSRLYRNGLNDDNFLKVVVRGRGAGYSPRDGTGTRVELWDDGGGQLLAVRELSGGEGYGSHGPRVAHFGLAAAWGGAAGSYQLRVRFTSGHVAIRDDVVPADLAATQQTLVVEELRPDGEPCLGPSDCDSGHCVDDVCCDAPCSGDCGVCAEAAGASADGRCTLLSGTICRAPAGVCDAPERCDGLAGECPADALFAQGTICRLNSGACDATERCDGQSADCPADEEEPAGTPCPGGRCREGSCVADDGGGPPLDGGSVVTDAGDAAVAGDAVVDGAGDGGDRRDGTADSRFPNRREAESCACQTSAGPSAPWLALLLLWLARGRRWRGGRAG